MSRFAARPLAAAARVQIARSTFSIRSVIQIFDNVDDVFELQRGLNNAFSYDLVPAPSVIAAALKASRRVNDYATAVRVFEGLKVKTDSDALYKQYLDELASLKAELGVDTKEELGL
ncbi:Cytochrome c oxidase subunit 6 [Mortierella sp. GBA30]|nr:Cytochrome c oxidase subunit 6 [Mortierella sp. GBA30]